VTGDKIPRAISARAKVHTFKTPTNAIKVSLNH